MTTPITLLFSTSLPPLTLPYTPTTPLSTLLAQLHATHPQLAHQHLRFISSGRLLPPHIPLPSPPPPFLHVSISTAPPTIPTTASAAGPQRGFNRLLAAGFTHAEVAALRSEFRESGSGGGVEEEERWIEEGGTEAEGVGLMGVVGGVVVGWFWPWVAVLGVGCGGLGGERRVEMAVCVGAAINVGLGVVRWGWV